MPTNEQRRAAAKRQLERRNERQLKRAKQRKKTAIFSSLGVVVLAVAIVAFFMVRDHNRRVDAQNLATYKANTCEYKANPQEAKQIPKNKQVGLPPNPNPKLKKGTVNMDLQTNQGDIPVTLDRALAPCTVQSIQFLTEKKFYDNVKCHREVNAPAPSPLKVLQCGDPLGTGNGGPGYTSPDELPKNLKVAPMDPQMQQQGMPSASIYPRGSIAMANGGPNTNGSQFFLVYQDSYLPPNYNLFGKVSEAGLQTLDKIAKNGITPGTDPQTGKPSPEDGTPKQPVTITKATIDSKS